MGVTPLILFRNHSLPIGPKLSSFSLGLWGLVWLASSWLLAGNGAMALSQWQFNPQTQQLQFRWESAIAPRTFLLRNPTRIVIDLPQTTFRKAPINKTYSGLVREIRIAQFKPKTTRIVLELSPEAHLHSETVTLKNLSNPDENQWQLTPKISKQAFSLATLMQLPPAELDQLRSRKPSVEVPPVPATKVNSSSEASPTELSLAAGTKFRVRYRGKSPLNLQVAQPWQEVLFLAENLTNQEGALIAPAKTPVIGHFQTTSQGTRFIVQALITALEPATASKLESVIPLQGRSSLFRDQAASSRLNSITIPPNTVFTVELTEDWHYRK
ncbi:MAG: hypothetical protein BRC33_06580 [Cyanobacteria bacterium SW_9_44_58]|nr:MAG: hypothetical protein BRC33_06580 [Cyanobacteria bacterium SW_9_44_58]